MKAMILAAGRGKRMGALTDQCPKPLLRYRDQYLIEYPLRALKAAGFSDVVINVSYLAAQIIDVLGDGTRYGLNIHYSFEPEQGGLETGGGVLQALPLLGDAPFVVTSADVVCDFDFARLKDQDHDLHLVLVDNPKHHQEGDYGFNQETGRLDANAPKLNYAGIALMHPHIFSRFAPGFFPLRDVFAPVIAKGAASAQYFQGAWCNVGMPSQLQDAL